MKRIQPYPVALGLSFVFAILFLICIALHLLLPESSWHMYAMWEMILPGFTWLTAISVVLGIMEVFLGGFAVAYTLIPMYNYSNERLSQKGEDSAMKRLRFKPVAVTAVIFSVVTYILCVIFDLLFPQWAMYQLWEILLPGFTWISWGSFLIGLVDVAVYGLYVAAVFVPVYNYFRTSEYPEVQ